MPCLRSPIGLGRAAAALLGLLIAVNLFAVYADLALYDVTGDLMNGSVGGAVFRRADSVQSLHAVAGHVRAVSSVVCAVVYLCWFVRVRGNAGVFDPAEQSMQPWWAVGGWFVPFLNFWYPRRIALEVWDASSPAGTRRSHALVNIWWTLWTLSLLVGWLGGLDFGKSATADEIHTATFLAMFVDVARIAAGVPAILVVLRLTRMQHEKALARAGVPAGA
ncbi:DUF4328 domain-containing protein [Streptomyces sp. NPDC048504]|uniref:DUF4328 domain-containing protein n=1 Tax=Streptomyces sp. NPDC048504 TaxID=3365559 RepID=UPI003711D3DE